MWLACCLGVIGLLGGVIAALTLRLRSLKRERALFQKMAVKFEADLVDRRQIERELAHMASFADMAPNPIVEINQDRSIGYVNPAAEQTFPTLATLGTRHPLFEGITPAVDLLIRENKSLVTRPIKIEQKIYDQHISLLNGGPRVRLYMSDITELKRLDQLKSDFVNMVSHELRSPLTSLAASIKMLAAGMMGSINADQTHALELAQLNIDRLARMINDLLDVSKIEAGKLELHRARVDLSALVREVCLSFGPLAKERGIEIRSHLAPEPMETLLDRDKILQVLTNLMNNALKFTDRGYVDVSASRRGEAVQCTVADTGRGIAPENLPKVFGKFQQLGATPKGREKGTGLGLSLCKGFIELHGGKIWVENRPPQGSQFIFVLPQLTPLDIFKDGARTLFAEAVASGKALSLLRLSLPGWQDFRQDQEAENLSRIANQIQKFIQDTVRSDSDPVFENEGVILLALPDSDRVTAHEIAKRIQDTWRESRWVQSTQLPGRLEAKVVSYPEDGNLADELFSRLQAT